VLDVLLVGVADVSAEQFELSDLTPGLSPHVLQVLSFVVHLDDFGLVDSLHLLDLADDIPKIVDFLEELGEAALYLILELVLQRPQLVVAFHLLLDLHLTAPSPVEEILEVSQLAVGFVVYEDYRLEQLADNSSQLGLDLEGVHEREVFRKLGLGPILLRQYLLASLIYWLAGMDDALEVEHASLAGCHSSEHAASLLVDPAFVALI